MASRKSKRKRNETEILDVAGAENPTNAPEVRKPNGYPFTDSEVLVWRLKPYTSEKETPYWKSLKDDPLPQPFAFEYKSRGGKKRKNAAGIKVGGNEGIDQGYVVTATLTAAQVDQVAEVLKELGSWL